MPLFVMIDQFHVSFMVRRDASSKSERAAKKTLNSRRFRAALRDAVVKVGRRYSSLRIVRIEISR